jgi:hypothetical protein
MCRQLTYKNNKVLLRRQFYTRTNQVVETLLEYNNKIKEFIRSNKL